MGKRIAVIDEKHSEYDMVFFALLGWKAHDYMDMTTSLEKELINTGYYKVSDRKNLENIMQEKKLQMSDIADNTLVLDTMKLAGIDALVLVKSKFTSYVVLPFAYDTYFGEARMIDVNTGEVLWSGDSTRYLPAIFPIAYRFLLDNDETVAENLVENLVEHVEKADDK